jgi:hypothetical protein
VWTHRWSSSKPSDMAFASPEKRLPTVKSQDVV